ncbi:SDR family NAD(P)-dependent oxidoreductase [Zunongwangia endophytica]|uniref:SDR family NAD(P)-dependent oxidoreductase n=1 Tax=Zunongwangia endophytica TaxID=1808945 RepID=A0ABV8H2D8_9FLAO|nr:SDR family NAD(P)-dependent oxidoreductase [Zunongwangia endophytica]MDN3594414.1 SDR family NAD(P)-dependent oxidoreductase [Zunongwangia endophytica]
MKTVFITGANKGIGLETSKQLAELGYMVNVGSRNKTKGQKALENFKNRGITNVGLIEIDVTNSLKRLLNLILKIYSSRNKYIA